MTLRKFEVEVTQVVDVILDDEFLTDGFNKDFSSYMWKVNNIEQHAKHLAQMEARGMIGLDKFVEGYGCLKEMNCSASIARQVETCIELKE